MRKPDFSLTMQGVLVSMNAERKQKHWSVRAESTGVWREGFGLLALADPKKPKFEHVVILGQPYQHGGTKRKLSDAGNVYPTVKAAIDGLRDAKVIPDDSPEFVSLVSMAAPLRGPDALTLYVWEVDRDFCNTSLTFV